MNFIKLGILLFSVQGSLCQVYYTVTAWNSTTWAGETSTLNCTYENPSAATVSEVVWKIDGNTVFSYDALNNIKTPSGSLVNRRTNYSHTSSDTVLFIEDGEPEDSGIFECTLSPSSGQSSSDSAPTEVQSRHDPDSLGILNLTVTRKTSASIIWNMTMIGGLDTNFTVEENEEITIDATASCARPVVALQWLRNNTLLPDVRCHSGFTEMGRTRFYIENMKSSDQGSLELHASHPSFGSKLIRKYFIVLNESKTTIPPDTKPTSKGNIPQAGQTGGIVLFSCVLVAGAGGGGFAGRAYVGSKNQDKDNLEDEKEKKRKYAIGGMVDGGMEMAVSGTAIGVIATRTTY